MTTKAPIEETTNNVGDPVWRIGQFSVVGFKEDTGKRKRKANGKRVKIVRWRYQINVPSGHGGYVVSFRGTKEAAIDEMVAAWRNHGKERKRKAGKQGRRP